MKLSVVIPARNEAQSIVETIKGIFAALSKENIVHEILVVDDGSTDGTDREVQKISEHIPSVVLIKNTGLHGFGQAVICGLDHFTGDCVAIMMADSSDSPTDLVHFYRCMEIEKCDAVFGSRFIRGGKVSNYPKGKLVLNRMLNTCIQVLFFTSYNDTTNAFKLYRRETIIGLRPLLSAHFNLTVELPLKTIVRGYSFTVIPNSWSGRKFGVSKLHLKEAGSRYLFIIFYCLAEKYLSGRDYKKQTISSVSKSSIIRT